jgi:hypothetical protein
MATGNNGHSAAPARKVIVRVVVYYALLITAGVLLWRYLPRTHLIADNSLDALFGSNNDIVRQGKGFSVQPVDQHTLAATVTLAMTAAALLAIPIAWIYTLTRARRGYQQSVVQLLIILPVVVAGIVVLVKYSLALAFSLGGIAAAVRFRNTLDDSKDAVYVFLVTGLGIAAAVDLPVALVISILFNIVVAALWMTDFGRTPVALEGAMAERRLARARELARTGTFVARIDDEVLKNMTSEQLEGVARRAWSRAREHDPEGGVRKVKPEAAVVVRMRDAARIRPIVESQLDEATKRWSVDTVTTNDDGLTVVRYTFVAKKSKGPDELLSMLRAAGGVDPVDAELQ